MILVALALLGALFALLLKRRSKGPAPDASHDTTPALDAWLREALEMELAEGALGMRRSTPLERKKLARTLANDPDADVVGRIEETVRAVEIEFVRYDHESDVAATVTVRYEDGKTGTSARRLPLDGVPLSVRSDFEKKGSTRVYRSWAFPWQRAQAL